MPPAAGCLPPILSPASHAMRLARPSAAASSAEIRMTGGRSPGASGLRLARASASRRWLRVSSSPGGDGPTGSGAWAWAARWRCALGRGGLWPGRAWPPAWPWRGRGARACGYVAPTPASLPERSSARAALSGSARVGDGAHHRDPRRARRAHVGDVAGVDAADGEERRRGVRRRVAHQIQPDRRAARLGRRGVHGADPDVVDLGLGGGGVDLRGRVSGEPDDAIGPDQRAGLRHRHVVLARRGRRRRRRPSPGRAGR